MAGERIDVDQIPGRLAALELRGDRAFGRARAVHLDGDAGFLGEGLAVGLVIGGHGVAAPVDQHQFLGLREGAG